MVTLPRLLDKLETHYGPRAPTWPVDPWLFLVWWYCGYPASDAACMKGWASLNKTIGVEPEALPAADPAQLASALKPGGMFAEQRAMRLKETADTVREKFGSDLSSALRRMPLSKARAALRTFAGIGNPGADRILLFGGISPVAAVPSSCPRVLVRIYSRGGRNNYSRDYADAQKRIEAGIPAAFDARARAYLLLKAHGQELCRRSAPLCSACPVSEFCAWVGSKSRIKAV